MYDKVVGIFAAVDVKVRRIFIPAADNGQIFMLTGGGVEVKVVRLEHISGLSGGIFSLYFLRFGGFHGANPQIMLRISIIILRWSIRGKMKRHYNLDVFVECTRPQTVRITVNANPTGTGERT